MTSRSGTSGQQIKPGSASGGSRWSNLCAETFELVVVDFVSREETEQRMLEELKKCKAVLAQQPVIGMDRATAKQQLDAAYNAACSRAREKRAAKDNSLLCRGIAKKVLQADKAARKGTWINEPFQALARWFVNSRIECRKELQGGGLHPSTCETIIKAVLDNDYLRRIQEICRSQRHLAKGRLDAIVRAPKGDPVTTLRTEFVTSIGQVFAPKYVYDNKADPTNAEILKYLEAHKDALQQDYLQVHDKLLARQPNQSQKMVATERGKVQTVRNGLRGEVAMRPASSNSSQRSKKTGIFGRLFKGR